MFPSLLLYGIMRPQEKQKASDTLPGVNNTGVAANGRLSQQAQTSNVAIFCGACHLCVPLPYPTLGPSMFSFGLFRTLSPTDVLLHSLDQCGTV